MTELEARRCEQVRELEASGCGCIRRLHCIPRWRWALALTLAALGCATGSAGPPPLAAREAAAVVHRAPEPSEAEPYCAWYGDRRGDFLFLGTAAFWPTTRAAGGDPEADLAAPGPVVIGRFDLAQERFLAPLVISEREPSGTWDVLAHPDGALFFTTFFGAAGRVDPGTAAVERFPDAGAGLGELALGPDGGVLAARYTTRGSVVLLSEHGVVLAEHELAPVEGYGVAAKSVAYDASREEIWVTTDLLPEDDALELAHDARVIDARTGRELRRQVRPEVQFVHFVPGGAGYVAEVDGSQLRLREVLPARDGAAEPGPGRRWVLDEHFPAKTDFAQEVRAEADGRIVVTRWSGAVHVVTPTGEVRTRHLPPAPGGLFYTGVARGERLCATQCAGVTVVCAPAP